MSTEKHSELEHRVGRAEEQVAAARREIGALQNRAQRTFGWIGSFSAGAVFAVVGGYLAATVGAQGARGARNVEMVAPFSVRGAEGKEILRVYENGVEVSGNLNVRRPNGGLVAQISSGTETTGLYIFNTLSVPTTGATESTPAAFFGTKGRKGYLELSNDTNNKMVEAGSKDARGYVLVQPYQVSTDPKGDPSVLMGGRRK